jgi:flagellar assembly protein FliH
MSNLWPHESVGTAASVGSFAIQRGAPVFKPWGSSDEETAEEVELDLQAVQADAFAQGWEEGRRTAELEFAAERDALAKLAEALGVLRPEPTNALALLLAETVDRLVRQIVGSTPIDPALLIARAEAAAALIGEETEPARLRVAPDDVPLLQGARIPVAIVADPNIERGSLLLETGQGWIEDGAAVRLDRLRAELDRMGAAE